MWATRATTWMPLPLELPARCSVMSLMAAAPSHVPFYETDTTQRSRRQQVRLADCIGDHTV